MKKNQSEALGPRNFLFLKYAQRQKKKWKTESIFENVFFFFKRGGFFNSIGLLAVDFFFRNLTIQYWIGFTKKNSYTAYSKQNTANKQKKNHIVFTLSSYTTGLYLLSWRFFFRHSFIHSFEWQKKKMKKKPRWTTLFERKVDWQWK